MSAFETFDFQDIDTILLDMDGTLLDLHFDNHFWLDHLPRRFGEIAGLPEAQARKRLHDDYQALRGKLDWYCLDYWCRELAVDIVSLKQEVAHLIDVHPWVPAFLERAGTMGKRRVIVTNAHRDSINLKVARTALDEHVDRIISSHDYRCPKEDACFWSSLARDESFDPDRTVLVDDNLSVLDAAARFGIRHLLAIARPDSRLEPMVTDPYPALPSFEILYRALGDAHS
ncbi:MAG: GMP/IMP nucleotidase [Halothiobacillaceae bacterium]